MLIWMTLVSQKLLFHMNNRQINRNIDPFFFATLYIFECISLEVWYRLSTYRQKHQYKKLRRKETQTRTTTQTQRRGVGTLYIQVSMSVNVKCTLQSSIKIELWWAYTFWLVLFSKNDWFRAISKSSMRVCWESKLSSSCLERWYTMPAP